MHSEKSWLIESDYRFNYVRKARGGRSCEGGTPGCRVWLTRFLVSPPDLHNYHLPLFTAVFAAKELTRSGKGKFPTKPSPFHI